MMMVNCSTSRTWLPSYTDPDFVNVSFRSVAALADTNDFSWRQAFERGVVEELQDQDAVCYEGSALLPPTRTWDGERIREVLSGRGIDAWLTVCTVQTQSHEEIIPEQRVTNKEKKPVVERVRYRENGRWVEKDSVTGMREEITTRTDPAHAVQRVRKLFHITLIDVITGRTAWVGDYWTAIEAGYLPAMCKSIARQLVLDGIVRKK